MASDLSGLDLLVIQIDGIHMDDDLILVAALGVDAKGDKHPLGLAEGSTENASTVQALIDNLVERGLDPTVPRLFIIDGAKALTKALAEPSELPRQSSAVRSTRPATLWSDCPNRCMLRFDVCCDKPGSWTMPTRLKSCSATLPKKKKKTGPGSLARSWKASMRSLPSRGFDRRRSYDARSPVPTSSRT